jgi:adenylyl cyclase-associated protein
MSVELKGLIDRLEKVVERFERQQGTTQGAVVNGHSSTSAGPTHPSVIAFEGLCNDKLKEFLTNSNNIGAEVKQVAGLVEKLFNLEKQFLNEAVKSAKPSENDFSNAIQPLANVINEIQSLKDKNRKSDYFNYLSAISESIGALGWITVSPAPCPFIKEMSDAGQFYSNRVLKEAKEK